jgi:NADH-quinone oxidoreductase subunit L
MGTAYSIMVSLLIVIMAILLTSHVEPFPEFVHAGYVESSFAVGMLVMVSYGFALFKPRVQSLSPVGTFLSDRMYLPFLNDFIVPKVGWAIAKVVDYGNRLIDFTCHQAIPQLFETYSHGVRYIQSGSMERYLKIVVGFVLLVIVIAVLEGW